MECEHVEYTPHSTSVSVMASNQELDFNKDDLPLRANTNHILVRHYVLDLSVDFQRKVIGGNIVLFLEPGLGTNRPEENKSGFLNCRDSKESMGAPNNTVVRKQLEEPNMGEISQIAPHVTPMSKDFTLILDCCDLLVSKVEEVDVSAVLNLEKLPVLDQVSLHSERSSSSSLVQRLIDMPSAHWRRQQDLYLQCSCASSVSQSEPIQFHIDQWSLQVSKKGVRFPRAFPRVVRIWYETKPTPGGSVRWTKTQDGT